MASATGLLDQHEDRWDTDMLGKLPIAVTALPAVGTEPLRGLKGAWARKWPALASVPWYPPVGDGACSNVGSGCVGRNRPALMVGTSGAMRVLLDGAPIDPPAELWRYRLDAARYVVGGALSEGGNVVAWLRKILRLPAQSETERALSTIGRPVGGERLDFLPILAGERSPGWSDGANGMIVGLTTTTEPLDILKAAMEGVALRFAAIAEPLDTALPGDKLVVATGGALLSSPAWVQIMADVLGKPLALSPVEEASSRGAALLAIERLGGLRIEKESGPDEEIFKPDPDRHRVYRLALDRQQVLYDLANRAWHNLPRASALAHEADERLRGGADEC
jgi:gluconokinase